MQNHTFKEVLDRLEHDVDSGSSTHTSHLQSNFESMAVSMFSSPQSSHSAPDKFTPNPNSVFFGAYSENIEPTIEDLVRSGPEHMIEHSDPLPRHMPQRNRGTGSRPAAHSRSRQMTLMQLKSSLRRNLSIRELGRLRRRFAIQNHPDQVTAQERDAASHRLAIANDLIDRAINKAAHRKRHNSIVD